MANRKLAVDIEVDAADAKRKIESAVPGVGDAASASGDTLARSNDRLVRANEISAQRMASMTRAFTGMAVGLAASYSARYFDRGSTPEKALTYGGNILSGASAGAAMGMAAGPWGAAAGGAAGGIIAAIKTFLDRDYETNKATEDFETAEAQYEGNRTFANDLKSITSPFNGESLDTKLATLSDIYDRLKNEIDDAKKEVESALDTGDTEGAGFWRKLLDQKRAQLEAVYNTAEKMELSRPDAHVTSRHAAFSALEKIGGGATFQRDAGADIAIGTNAINQKWMPAINALLKEIRDNLGKKGESWL